MKVHHLLILASAYLAQASAAVATDVSVFGLPLGGKLPGSVKACPTTPLDVIDTKRLCWAGKPLHTSTGLSGPAHLPGQENRPKWAAYATFEMDVSREGVLRELKVRTVSSRNKREIVDSISGRFGPPSYSNMRDRDVSSVKWIAECIYIDMLCDRVEFCLVEFRSKDAWLDRERDREASMQVDRSRPRAP